jgi:hypothetical protein
MIAPGSKRRLLRPVNGHPAGTVVRVERPDRRHVEHGQMYRATTADGAELWPFEGDLGAEATE